MKEGSDCPSGKEQFTRDGAQERAALWRARGERNMRFYRCDMCDTYHVGHNARGRRWGRAEKSRVKRRRH